MYVISLLLMLFAPLGHCLIPPQETVSVPQGQISQNTRLNTGKILPTNLSPGSSEEDLQLRIIDHSVNTFIADQLKEQKSGVWRAARKIRDMQGSMTVTTGTDQGPVKKVIKHEFTLRMQALQKFARINYQGYFNAEVGYFIEEKDMRFELSQRILEATQVVYNYRQLPDRESNEIIVRWDWD